MVNLDARCGLGMLHRLALFIISVRDQLSDHHILNLFNVSFVYNQNSITKYISSMKKQHLKRP